MKKKWKPWIIEKIISKGDYYYAIVRNHPYRTKNDYVLHHRVIKENEIGRLLTPEEIVHHKNEKKKDNRPSNLEIMCTSTHATLHSSTGRKYVELKCPECKSLFNREERQTFLAKSGKFTACSASCRGKFSRKIQLEGLTSELKQAIVENVQRKYVDYTKTKNK